MLSDPIEVNQLLETIDELLKEVAELKAKVDYLENIHSFEGHWRHPRQEELRF